VASLGEKRSVSQMAETLWELQRVLASENYCHDSVTRVRSRRKHRRFCLTNLCIMHNANHLYIESKISSLLDRPREVGMETDVQLGAHICPLFNVTSKKQWGKRDHLYRRIGYTS